MLSNKKDTGLGVFFSLIGLIIFILSFTVKKRTVLAIGPGFMPRVIGVVILVLGVALLVQTILRKSSEEVESDEKVASSTPFLTLQNRKFILALSMVLVTLYVGLLEPLGFPLMTVIYLTLQFYILADNRGWKKFLVYFVSAVACSLIVTIIFTEFLGLFLPLGIFR